MDIDNLEPGTELDTLVAEKFLGWTPLEGAAVIEKLYDGDTNPEYHTEKVWAAPRPDGELERKACKECGSMPAFSTDIALAMGLWQIARESGQWCCLTIGADHDYCWRLNLVPVAEEIDGSDYQHEPLVTVDGIAGGHEGLAFGICIALLKSKGVIK